MGVSVETWMDVLLLLCDRDMTKVSLVTSGREEMNQGGADSRFKLSAGVN